MNEMLLFQSLADLVNTLFLMLTTSLLALVSRLLGGSLPWFLRAARRLAAVLQRLLSFGVPEGLAGAYHLGHTVANVVQQLLEHSATASVGEEEQEVLQGQLQGLPPPVASYLQYSLEGLAPGTLYRLAHIKIVGHFRFLPGAGTGAGTGGAIGTGGAAAAAAAAAAAPSGWHAMQGECYITPASPAYVWSITLQLGPLSWVRGFASYVRGAGLMQWKLGSLFRMRDIDPGQTDLPVGLAAFLTEAPFCPTALLPSSKLRWKALTECSAEATVCDCQGEASAVFHFNRAGQLVKICSRTPRNAALRGAGSSAAGAAQRRSPPTVWYYRQYRQHCGMQVPTKLEAAWQLPSGEHSFAHLDVVQLSAWTSLEMPASAPLAGVM